MERGQHLPTVLKTASDGFVALDGAGRITDVNEAYCALSGYSRDELLGSLLSGLDAVEAARTSERVVRCMESGLEVFETRHRRKDNSVFDVEMIVVYQETGGDRLLCLCRDITAHKRAEEAIEKRIVALTQPLGDTADVAFEDLFNLADIQRLQDEFCAATRVASVITKTDGTPITVPGNFCRLCLDIIRKTEKGLANCYKSDATLGRHHPEGPTIRPCLSCGLWDAGASIQVGGRHIANWLIGQVRDGTQTEEQMREYAREIGADEQQFVEAFHEVPQMSRHQFEHVAKMLFTLANQLSTTAYQNVQQARFITERKKAEEAMRESEERLRLALSGADLGAWDWYVPSGVVTVNERWASMLGYSLDEINTSFDTWKSLIHPDDMSGVMQILTDHLEGRTETYEVEHRLRHKSGDCVWVLSKGRVIERDVQGKPLRACGTHLDITARKRAEIDRARLEAQLQQLHKMESVGRLAGGVAHDFNNMLGVILGHVDLALDLVEPANPIHAGLEEIRKAAERSANLTRQLLAFARRQTAAPIGLDLNETVERMLNMLQRLVGENIRLAWRPGAGLWTVKVDPSQIDQILANLCANARDAIRDTGTIAIDTCNTTLDEAYCADRADFVPGEYVMLAVKDNGCGMDKETVAHIFEPFFTTKGIGDGTGLGLATVYGVVKQNEGLIEVCSEPGQGTSFNIYFPRHEGEAEQAQKESGAQVQRGEETILLVEDELSLLTLTAAMLERLGYTVLSASTRSEAIRLARDHSNEIDLLMTDVVMPEMNGQELVEMLVAHQPNLRRLFMSGYTADIIARHGVLDEGVHFIQKPFTSKGLAAKLREVLDNK